MPIIELKAKIPCYPGDTLYYADELEDGYWTIRKTTVQEIHFILLPDSTFKMKVEAPEATEKITNVSKEEIFKNPPYPIEKYIDSLAMKIFR